MKARANTRVDILQAATVDSFGDPKDLPRPVREGVTASIIERSKTVTNPDDGTIRRVSSLICRVPSGTPVSTQCRVRDQATGDVYIVDSVSQSRNPVRGDDIRLELRRVT